MLKTAHCSRLIDGQLMDRRQVMTTSRSRHHLRHAPSSPAVDVALTFEVNGRLDRWRHARSHRLVHREWQRASMASLDSSARTLEVPADNGVSAARGDERDRVDTSRTVVRSTSVAQSSPRTLCPGVRGKQRERIGFSLTIDI